MRVPASWLDRNQNRRKSFDGMINNILNDLRKSSKKNRSRRFGSTDIYKEEDSLFYEIETPGLSKDEVEVRKDGKKLEITGQIERESQSKDRNYIAKGRRHGEFKRVLPLPELTKSDEIEAHFENGLLKIRAPLKEKGDEKMEIRID